MGVVVAGQRAALRGAAAAAKSALMRENTRTMNVDMTRAIARSIQIGEARAKAVEAQAMGNIKKTVQGLRTLASEKIEAMANKVFATVQQNRQKVADNYLSLKAYAAKGKGRGLGSIGDLLKTVGKEDQRRHPRPAG